MPGLQLCCDPGGVLWPGPELQSGSVALAPAWRARRRTARAHVVLLLGRLGTDANTDLMEPPIAAAITLDPVHLVSLRLQAAHGRADGVLVPRVLVLRAGRVCGQGLSVGRRDQLVATCPL